METAIRNFLLDVPQAAALWSVLMLVAVLAFALLSAPGLRERPLRGRPAQRAAAAAEAHRFAAEVAVAAAGAVATAHRRRTEWLAAHEAEDAAWRAFTAAESALRRAAQAAAFRPPGTARTPAEFADRERYLHRAATAACRRKELSVRQLSDILAHRAGWDPRRHPVDQELLLRRAARAHLSAAYRSAVTAERAAWHTAGVAAAAAETLRAEALNAAEQAALTARWLRPAARAERQPVTGAVRGARLATR